MPPDTHPDLLGHVGLTGVLDRARRLGFTGDAAPGAHIAHALRFLPALERFPPTPLPASTPLPTPLDSPGVPAGGPSAVPCAGDAGDAGDVGAAGDVWGAVDLGSGAGLPGLVLALALPESTWVLVEAMQRRADPLAEAVHHLGLADRVEVWCGRAEGFARQPGQRGGATLVTARGFGGPGVTAECAAPLLRQGGLLLVSEPPASDGARWSREGLRQLGLAPEGVVEGIMVCRAVSTCPDQFPRRVGTPAKRPLF